MGGTVNTVILGNVHMERPLRSRKDPQGSFPWDIIDGVGFIHYCCNDLKLFAKLRLKAKRQE
jgi:hypothetical protein